MRGAMLLTAIPCLLNASPIRQQLADYFRGGDDGSQTYEEYHFEGRHNETWS